MKAISCVLCVCLWKTPRGVLRERGPQGLCGKPGAYCHTITEPNNPSTNMNNRTPMTNQCVCASLCVCVGLWVLGQSQRYVVFVNLFHKLSFLFCVSLLSFLSFICVFCLYFDFNTGCVCVCVGVSACNPFSILLQFLADVSPHILGRGGAVCVCGWSNCWTEQGWRSACRQQCRGVQ